MQRQTTIAKANEIQRKWYVIDAEGKPLGRLASQVAQVLIGITNQHGHQTLIVVIMSSSSTVKKLASPATN